MMHLLEWMEYLIRVKRTGRIETGPDFDNRGAVKRIDEDRAELTEIGRELLVVLTERLHMEQRITALEADLAAALDELASHKPDERDGEAMQLLRDRASRGGTVQLYSYGMELKGGDLWRCQRSVGEPDDDKSTANDPADAIRAALDPPADPEAPGCGDDVGEPGSRAALEAEFARLRFELAEALPDAERFRALIRMSEEWPSEWHVGHHKGHPPDAHVVHLTVLGDYFTGATFVEAFDKAIAALGQEVPDE
jgi:hypothetical protein